MSTGELLNIEPQELKFPFELKKKISSSLQLSNKTDNYVAFKVKTTNPKKYCVRPKTGVVLPSSTCDVIDPERNQYQCTCLCEMPCAQPKGSEKVHSKLAIQLVEMILSERHESINQLGRPG